MTLKLPAIAVNGIINQQVSPLDRGFTYGDGVFETCRMIDAKIPLWNLHSQRLQKSCHQLMIPVVIELVESYIAQLIACVSSRDLTDAVVKIIVTRGQGGRGYRIATEAQPTLCIGIFSPAKYAENYADAGISVRMCSHRLSCNKALAGLKHLNRLEHILARAEWNDDAIAEGLLLDSNNYLIEATASNIFCTKNGILLTPDLTEAGVAGVLRRLIIEDLSPKLGLTLQIKKLTLNDLLTADEIFLCNSVNGIWPVVNISSQHETQFHIGKTTRLLQQELQHELQKK
jgi:4-amino-4-deoxychorismate lyase